jgi:serine protease AprX
MSLGPDEHSQAICDAVSRAVQKGKIVVCAAGNSGPNGGTIGCPSDNKDAITVGAIDSADQVCKFSSRGPMKDGCVKPDVVAPGYKIISCRASGIMENKAIDSYYLAESGTSMACPMVSGTVALLVQKDPKLTPPKAKEILQKTAKRLGATMPNSDYGYGLVSIRDALKYLDGNRTAPTPAPTPGKSPVPSPTPSPVPGNPVQPWPGVTPTPGPVYPGYPGPYPAYPYYPGYQLPQFPGYNIAYPVTAGNPYAGYPVY